MKTLQKPGTYVTQTVKLNWLLSPTQTSMGAVADIKWHNNNIIAIFL